MRVCLCMCVKTNYYTTVNVHLHGVHVFMHVCMYTCMCPSNHGRTEA